ncbi:DUF1048 domain-containing protein [Streptomyces buecherae]|uniref:DUF1048 domain-containing protein n=1 Tax=Streptomyces buecherae TaxID=2763006 RepID=UPI00379B993D
MSDAEKSGFLSRVIGPKKRWRAYKARVRDLPANYRLAAEAIERHLMHFVPTDNDNAATMFEDLADLIEEAAANGTPIREIVGEDPAEFVAEFAQNYTDGAYVPASLRERLANDIARAEAEPPEGSEGTA